MNSIVLYNEFHFFRITLDKYHHTDNRHGASEHYIAYMEEGSCRLVSEKETVEINTGDVFYIPMGLAYQSYWYGNNRISFMTLGFKLFPESADNNFLVQKIDCSDEIKAEVRKITVNKPVDSRTISAFFDVLSKLLPLMKAEKTSRAQEIYTKAREYISRNTDCAAKDISKHCAISESTLYWAFKTAANKTPNEVKNEILCQKAVMLLSNTDKSVQEISDSLGFSSTSYFRKILRNYTDKTPSTIRKKRV